MKGIPRPADATVIASIRAVFIRDTAEDDWRVAFARIDLHHENDADPLEDEDFDVRVRLRHESIDTSVLIERISELRHKGILRCADTRATAPNAANAVNSWINSSAAQHTWRINWPCRRIWLPLAREEISVTGFIEGPTTGTYSGVDKLIYRIAELGVSPHRTADMPLGVNILVWDYRGTLDRATATDDEVRLEFQSGLDRSLRVRGVAFGSAGESSLSFEEAGSRATAPLPAGATHVEVELVDVDEAGAIVDVASFSTRASEQHPELAQIAQAVERGEAPQVSTRELLRWFGAERRGSRVLERVEHVLGEYNLKTRPDYRLSWIDGAVTFVSADADVSDAAGSVQPEDVTLDGYASVAPSEEQPPVSQHEPGGSELAPQDVAASETEWPPANSHPDDPRPGSALRLSHLASANRAACSASPDSTIESVATLMLVNDYSQIPLLTGKTTTKSVVKWHHIVEALLHGKTCSVGAIGDPVRLYEKDDAFLQALPEILTQGFVLVRNNGQICIVTMEDVIVKFQESTEAFLLLSQIEQELRVIVGARFSSAEIAAAIRDSDGSPASVHDMSFGDYVALLEKPENWARLQTRMDRQITVRTLTSLNGVRNGVMHFSPDGLNSGEIEVLRRSARLFSQMVKEMPLAR